MKDLLKKYFVRILFLTPPLFWGGWEGLIAQNKKIDSLLTLLKKDKEDTNKVKRLNALAGQLSRINIDTAILLSQEGLSLSENLRWNKGSALSMGNLGIFNRINGDYPRSLDYYLKAMQIDKMLGNTSAVAIRLGNIGNVYTEKGDYPKALEYYLKALKIKEQLKDKAGVSITLTNIGVLYAEQGNFTKALDYYFRVLKIIEALGDKNGIALVLDNIGSAYLEQAKASNLKRSDAVQLLNKALDYYFRAYKIDETLRNKIGVARHLGNIGNVYQELEDYPKALEYDLRALKIANELGDKKTIAINLGNIGALDISAKQFSNAEKYLIDALQLNQNMGAQNYERQNEANLSRLYEYTGKFQLSLSHYKKAMTLKDTLFSQENKKQLIRKEMNFDFEKKELAAKAEQDKKDAVAKEELKQKEQQRNYFIIGFALVGILAVFILRSLWQNKKKNKIISAQKEQVDKAYESLHEKNKEVMDSIRYAKRIQTALITSEKYFTRKLNELNKN